MHLSPKETDRLLLFLAAELARRRRARGLRLNYPEARALIADEILEGARDGRSVAELMELRRGDPDDRRRAAGRRPARWARCRSRRFFEDGQKLVTVHEPIGPGSEPVRRRRCPGEIGCGRGRDRAERGPRDARRVTVANTRRPAGSGRLALPLLRGQPRAASSTAARRSACASTSRPAPRFASSRARSARSSSWRSAATRRAARAEPADRGRRPRRATLRSARARERGYRGGVMRPSGSRRRAVRRAVRARPTGDRVRLGDTDLWARGRAATCSCRATSACSAAARRCATASGRTARSRPRTGALDFVITQRRS